MSADQQSQWRSTHQDSFAYLVPSHPPVQSQQQAPNPFSRASQEPYPQHQHTEPASWSAQTPPPQQPRQQLPQHQQLTQLTRGMSRAMSYEEAYRSRSLTVPVSYANPLAWDGAQSPQQRTYSPERQQQLHSSAGESNAPSAPPLPEHSQPQSHQAALQPSGGALYPPIPASYPPAPASQPAAAVPHLSIPNQQQPSTADDAAIAHALARELGTSPSMQQQRTVQLRREQDTSLDQELALQVHEEEVDALCRDERGETTPSPEPSTIADYMNAAWNGEVAGVSHLVPVIPRVNAIGPWPMDSVSRDRERLQLRLDFYGLAEKHVKGDGNCQFRALSDQLYSSEQHHAQVRRTALDQLAARPDKYALYVPSDYGSYLSSMAQEGAWGDHVTLQAVADALGMQINVVSSFLENGVISINPEKPPGDANAIRTLWLSFWAEVHYNSIYPKGYEHSSNSSSSGKVLGSKRLGKFVHKALSPLH